MNAEDPGCYTNDCYFGRHDDCRDVAGNCCDCSCHCGVIPTTTPYLAALTSAKGTDAAIHENR